MFKRHHHHRLTTPRTSPPRTSTSRRRIHRSPEFRPCPMWSSSTDKGGRDCRACIVRVGLQICVPWVSIAAGAKAIIMRIACAWPWMPQVSLNWLCLIHLSTAPSNSLSPTSQNVETAFERVSCCVGVLLAVRRFIFIFLLINWNKLLPMKIHL